MNDLTFIIALYVVTTAVAFFIGAAATQLGMRWRKRVHRRTAASRLSFDQAFPIIDEWAGRNSWYLENVLLNQAAQLEHMRLMRDEPGLTLDQNLERVARAVKEKYPAAFQTLH